MARSEYAPHLVIKPWTRFARALLSLWLAGSLLLLGIGIWQSLHIQEVTATVTSNTKDSDGSRWCDIAWQDPDGTPRTFEDLSCTDANETGTTIQVHWTLFWEYADTSLPSEAAWSVLWFPLIASVMLGAAVAVVGLLLALPFALIIDALDRRSMRQGGQTRTVRTVR